MNIVRTTLLAAVAIVAVACNSTDAENLSRDAGNLAETAGVAASNATLAGKVNTALSLRKGVHMEGMNIQAEGGTVTVGGHVKTQKEKTLVMEIVRETRGVDKVVDELRVEP